MTFLINKDKITKPAAAIFVLFILSTFACARPSNSTDKIPGRIISMAPSITEALFELGLGDRLAGVTRYCDYSDAVNSIPKVGGYMDPNYEEIIALKPDLVILLASHKEAIDKFSALQIATLALKHETIEDIQDSIRRTAEACGVAESADRLLADMKIRTALVQRMAAGRTRPRVMICIGRDTQSENMTGVYIAGKNNFYDEVITLSGGINAYTGTLIPYPQLSAEGIISLNPDVIIDISDQNGTDRRSISRSKKQWSKLSSVKAVSHGRIYFIQGTYALHPGPRYINLMEKLAPLLHPGAFQGKSR